MYRYRNIVLLVLCLFLGTVSVFAQTDRHDVRKGNRDFKKEKYAESQIDYSKALIKDSTSFAANYNLGNTLYRLGDAEQARKSYSNLQEVAPFSPDGDKLMYNIGNASAMVEDWQTAVDAYKASLLMNPGDIEAKENYIYAKSRLEEQENEDQNQDCEGDSDGGGGGGGDDDQDQNDDNQDQNQDQNGGGDDDQNDQNDQNQDQQQGGGDEDQQNQDQQQGQGQPEISPQQAQQMLQAIQAKDNETLDKVNKEKAEVLKKKQREKNW